MVEVHIESKEIVKDIRERQEDMLGNVFGRAFTATLRVSPDGSGADGLSWRTAYTTIPNAVAAASDNANDLTLLLLSPGEHDMNTTGDPVISKNIALQGALRNWTSIVNNHAGATSVIGFTAHGALFDLAVDCGTGSNNGVVFAGAGANGARLERVYVECENVTGAQDGIVFSGGVEYVILLDVKVHGSKTNTTGLYLNNCALSTLDRIDFVDCLTGLNISNVASDNNLFTDMVFANCTLAIDINGGNGQSFRNIGFASCTRNVDDEVGDHSWVYINDHFNIRIEPDDLVGISVSTGAAGVYGADTQLVAAGAIDNPFRVVGYAFDPSTTEWYQVRFSDDSGTTFFEVEPFYGQKQVGTMAPAGTEHIFNKGTRISCSARDVSGGDTVAVWLSIQEI